MSMPDCRKGCEEKLAELELRQQQQLRAAQEELQAMRVKVHSTALEKSS